jgi:RNA polymerase sigma-70 factor (ECF subfamily)
MRAERDDRLAKWFRELRQPLRRFLSARRGVAHADLDDVAQEVFLRLLRFNSADRITEPKAYLFKMAANVATEWSMRSRHRQPHDSQWLSELLAEGALEDDLQRAERDAEISRALGALPPRAQAILRLHFGDGLAHAAIAERLLVTRRIVKRELIRAYAELRVALDDNRVRHSINGVAVRAGGRQ